MDINMLVKRFESIKGNRALWESHWQEIADRCLPTKATITTSRHPGTKLSTTIYDSTAIYSTQVLAAGLHSYMTNPTSRWYTLEMQNRALMEVAENKRWLKDCEDIIFSYLNSSNFNQAIHEAYIELSALGNCCLYEDEDIEDVIKFHARPIAEIFILANASGRIDTVYRSFSFTARQAKQLWGNNCGEKIDKLIEAGKVEEMLPFLHIVLPREDRDVRKGDARNMPWASLYIEPKTKKILSEGGYEEFPFFTPRFYKVAESEYAYGPGSLAMADIKTLNSMSKTILKGAQKSVDPPIILPDDGYILPFRSTAGAVNLKNSMNVDAKVEVLDIKRDIGIGLAMEDQRRKQIKWAFFVDLFLMLANIPDKQRTAYEISARVNEMMLMLGPVLGRLMHELLDPIIIRTFGILARNFKLPPPPASIPENEHYKIKYISPLAKAQRASEIKSINDFLVAIREMAEMNANVVDNVNFDKTAQEIAEKTNISSELLNSDDEVKAIREQRAQAQEVQQALEQATQGAEAAQKIIEAEKTARGGE